MLLESYFTNIRYASICDVPYDCNYYDDSKAKAKAKAILLYYECKLQS
jgi:hypothetical protein